MSKKTNQLKLQNLGELLQDSRKYLNIFYMMGLYSTPLLIPHEYHLMEHKRDQCSLQKKDLQINAYRRKTYCHFTT